MSVGDEIIWAILLKYPGVESVLQSGVDGEPLLVIEYQNKTNTNSKANINSC